MLTDEKIQALLMCDDPTEDECSLIRMGYAAAQPQWSDQPPTVPGWYWYRPPYNSKPAIIEVCNLRGVLLGDDTDIPISEWPGQWAGPIIPPDSAPAQASELPPPK